MSNNLIISKILNECKPFKKQGLNIKKIKKYLKKFNLLNKTQKETKEKPDNIIESNKKGSLTLEKGKYDIEAIFSKKHGFKSLFKFNKKLNKKDFDFITDISEINGFTVLNILGEIKLKDGEIIEINESVGFEEKELKYLKLESITFKVDKKTLTMFIESNYESF